ncbi:cytochrome b5 [Temnothorax americanus]|uniref:cytochrome b5 n=1 Tax=Temnothorax americanus TaxID=1964332 RepID=UPI004068CD36
MAEKRVFTRSEIKKNNDKGKVLIVLHDKVYNVHTFLNEHPGGEEILLDHKGQDGSEDFDDVGHSKDAMELMKKYQVGTIDDSERANKPPRKGWVAGYNTNEQKDIRGPGMPFYLLMSGIVLAASFLFFALKKVLTDPLDDSQNAVDA